MPLILEEIYGHILVGHNGLKKTKERPAQCYYWPNTNADITAHIQSFNWCQMCQSRAPLTSDTVSHRLQPFGVDQWVHTNSFGPLKTFPTGKKYVLCITDTFTKYVQIISLHNKEAFTNSTAIFDHWVCCFGAPINLISDHG
jgi:Integrase zinc binding domain